MLKKILLITCAAVSLHALQAAEVRTDNLTASRTGNAEAKGKDLKAAEREKAKRIEELTEKRQALLLKIHQKRKDLLKNNPKLRRMYLQLLKDTRELALELDANREMRELNDQLQEVERELNQKQKK